MENIFQALQFTLQASHPWRHCFLIDFLDNLRCFKTVTDVEPKIAEFCVHDDCVHL